MRPHGFPAKLRLKQRREFLRVQRGGRKIHVRHFMVFVSPRRLPKPDPSDPSDPSDLTADRQAEPTHANLLPTRCGITVTRKVGNAVARNRIKRLVREVFRQHRARLPTGLDMVWVAKQQAAAVDFAGVMRDFDLLARELAKPSHDRPRRSQRPRGNRGRRS